jgi:hypothetical protein
MLVARCLEPTIFASGNKAEIKNVDKTAGKIFAETVRNRMTVPPTTPETDAAPTPRNDLLEQIRKLGDLRDAGILTDEEFTAQRPPTMHTASVDEDVFDLVFRPGRRGATYKSTTRGLR